MVFVNMAECKGNVSGLMVQRGLIVYEGVAGMRRVYCTYVLTYRPTYLLAS
jgi:hypothetical protein